MPELNRPAARFRPRAASLRHLLRRSRWPRVVLVVTTALACGALIDDARDNAARAATAWGATDAVWVATEDLDAGLTITADAVASRTLPLGALPRDPVRESPVGQQLRAAVGLGEILRLDRLAGSGLGEVAARVPSGSGGIQLPRPAPYLSPGDIVDLYALLTGDRVSAAALVIAVDEGMATVAVATIELPAVVRTFTTGDVVPVVVG